MATSRMAWISQTLSFIMLFSSVYSECISQVYKNTYIQGGDISRVYTPDEEYCRTVCTYHPRCLVFSYLPGNFANNNTRQKCYLKFSSTGIPVQIRHLRGVVSGFSLKRCRLSETDCRMDIFQHQVFSGIHLTTVLTPDAHVCRTICTYQPNCLFFTFRGPRWEVKSERYTCLMMTSKSGMPDAFIEGSNAMSGFSLRNCRKTTPACHNPTFSNLNFIGMELSVEFVNGSKACQQLCTDTVRCQFFTYVSHKNLCNQEGKCKCYLRMTPSGSPYSITSENEMVSGYSLRLCQTKVSSVCEQKPNTIARIVGGMNAFPAEWPWQVSLHVKLSTQSHMCGGSIIRDQWILTAAHCTEDLLITQVWRIYSGILKQSEINENTSVFKVQEIIVHPKYVASEQGYDIALMKLDRPMNFSALQQPLCLPSEEINTKYDECWVTGWGYTKETGQIEDTLQKVKIPLISNEECQNQYQDYRITEKMLCAGYAEGARDACKGDSGGPLSCKYQNKWYLAGITSWGEGCARPGQPGVYTNVAEFVGWILENTL
uniref:Plasma kallikrein isoform X3 n=1 Tax=Pogona vitticeps TaxID=103695 RepID=A0A6J0TLP5_9SAUR